MQTRRPVLGMEMPSLSFQFDGQLVNVDAFRAEGKNRGRRVPQDKKARNRIYPLHQFQGGTPGSLRQPQEPLFPEVIQHGPAGSDGPAGPGSAQSRRCIDPAGPIGIDEELVPAKLAAPVQHRGNTFRHIAVFMNIHRHGLDAGQSKVKGRNLLIQLPEEGQHVPAQAGIHVEPEVPLRHQGADLG